MPRTGARTRALLAAWGLLAVAGLVALWHYELTPGATAELRQTWPSSSHLARARVGPTLVLFAHPRCPCTRASLSELRRVLSPFSNRVLARVVFFGPGESPATSSLRDTHTLAESIPGVVVANDADGSEAARFGATTSGHVVLYSQSGELLFSGGITPARGHEGDSPQRERLLELLRRETGTEQRLTLPANAPQSSVGAVYGCPLRVKR